MTEKEVRPWRGHTAGDRDSYPGHRIPGLGGGDMVFVSLSHFLDIYFQFLVIVNSLANYLLRVNSQEGNYGVKGQGSL